MIHLRIIAPTYDCDNVIDLLKATPSVTNLVYLPGAAQKPEGNVVLCDVAREDASVVIGDLKELNIHKDGSIAIEEIDSQLSVFADEAEKAARGAPSDAVVWEEVEARTSENIELSGNFVAFMVLAMLIAASGIFLDSTILIIGAMVVGPEFGPLAGLCVALIQRRRDVAKRSLTALAVGFPAGILAAFLFSLIVKWTDIAPESFSLDGHPFTQFISQPDAFSVIVAFFAGMAGVLSLTSTKSGALDRSADLGDDDPRRRQHRRRRRLRRRRRAHRGARPARPQPGRHPPRRRQHPLRAAAALREAPPRAPRPRGARGRRPAQGPQPQPAARTGGSAGIPGQVTLYARQLAILAAAFAAGVGLAEALGAVNLGVAFGVGQLTFAAALVWVLLRD